VASSAANIATDSVLTRYPSLDGLRAISVVFVLFGHLVGTRYFPVHDFQFTVGELGVRVFFVISGFLITSLLLNEIARDGSISLLRFYFRRSMRIFPAFYSMIAVIALLAHFDVISLRPYDLLAAVTYTTNYHPDRAYSLNHLWSLAVEEQFYLMWPALLLLLGRGRALFIAALFVLITPVVREATARGYLPGEYSSGSSFQTVGDAIAVGCLLAGMRPRLDGSAMYQRFARSPLFVVVPLLVLASSATEHSRLNLVVLPLSNIAIAMMILWVVTNDRSAMGRALNWRPVAYLGTLSYSLYLWQQLFLNPHDQTSAYTAFPLNLVFAVAAGVVSFYLVESPLLRWRTRLEPKLFAQRRGSHAR
jgi:peptidoglycan/LPS O-acetylase OafA/YrhL